MEVIFEVQKHDEQTIRELQLFQQRSSCERIGPD
jgi:hypothetical protein